MYRNVCLGKVAENLVIKMLTVVNICFFAAYFVFYKLFERTKLSQ